MYIYNTQRGLVHWPSGEKKRLTALREDASKISVTAPLSPSPHGSLTASTYDVSYPRHAHAQNQTIPKRTKVGFAAPDAGGQKENAVGRCGRQDDRASTPFHKVQEGGTWTPDTRPIDQAPGCQGRQLQNLLEARILSTAWTWHFVNRGQSVFFMVSGSGWILL